jgi:xanthine/uracil permease
MFGMITATGIKILTSISCEGRDKDLVLVATTVSIGMIPALAPGFFRTFPEWTKILTDSGIVLGTLVAVVLNLWFYGLKPRSEKPVE